MPLSDGKEEPEGKKEKTGIYWDEVRRFRSQLQCETAPKSEEGGRDHTSVRKRETGELVTDNLGYEMVLSEERRGKIRAERTHFKTAFTAS